MLVSLLVAPIGIVLGVLLMVFAITDTMSDPNTYNLGVRISFTIIFDLTSGLFLVLLLWNMIRRRERITSFKRFLYEVRNMEKLMTKPYWYLLPVLACVGYLGLWILVVIIKTTEMDNFLMSKFSIVALFAMVLTTVLVLDKLYTTNFNFVVVVAVYALFLVQWNLFRSTNNNSCSDDAAALIVGFLSLISWNQMFVQIMIMAACGLALYEEGFNQANCPRLSPFINEQLMSKSVCFTIIGLTFVKLVVRKYYGDRLFQVTVENQANEGAAEGVSMQNIVLEVQHQDRINYLENTKFVKPVNTNEEVTCSICTQGVLAGETSVKLKCRHEYHFECIKLWFDRHGQCPICRQNAVQ